ncbi:MAG: SurA N-terminal domain-containing protein [Lentisphaerae bacterium]|nr:SurA N-terminal domain-containing protein [Lentisphaerota bacterium]
MTMLITKFNRMIHNRILWAVFAVLMSLVLVGFLGAGRSGCDSAEPDRRGLAGTVFDRDVSRREFFAARFFELGMQNDPRLSPEQQDALRQATWERIAALDLAERMGITISDAEVAEVIRRDPAFATEGMFDRNRYQAIVRSRLGIPLATYEAFLAQDLVLRKLRALLEAASWIAPAELNYRLRNFTDVFSLAYATFSNDTASVAIALDANDLAETFERHREAFTLPEQVSVRYVAFPITNFLPAAEVSETEIEDYYDAHLEDYASTDTNEAATLFQPLEDVRGEITATLRRRKALFAARDKATEFVMALAPDRYGNALSLTQAVARFDLTLRTSEYFSVDSPVPGLRVDQTFNRAAFALEAADPEAYFSDAVTGTDNVYVLAAHDRVPPRDPDLDEVVADVRELAEAEALDKARRARVETDRADILSAMQAGASFPEAAAAQGWTVVTARQFSVYGTLEHETDMPYSDALIQTVTELQTGETSEPLPVENGWLLVHVIQREPGDIAERTLLKPELIAAIDRYRSALLFDDWRLYALEQANLEDYLAPPQDDGDIPPDDGAPPG